MRVLIYSDVHGNLPAFEAVLSAAGNCEAHICLGDLVNYGPWSNECVELAFALPNTIVIQGNHEKAFVDGNYPGNNLLVQEFFSKTIINFNQFNLISNLPLSHTLDDFLCIHTINERSIYPDTPLNLDSNFLIGHSHHQFVTESNTFRLINVGSVGQNRAIINLCDFVIYDTESKSFELKSVVYDFEKLIEKMKALDYSDTCLDYYLQKRRI